MPNPPLIIVRHIFLFGQAVSLPANAFTGLVNTLILLLLVATVVALVTRWLRIPYVIGLVLAGLLIPKQILSDAIGLNPEVILNLFLPILIFEAAINTDISRLRSTIKPIALLAGPGVLLAATITAFFLKVSLDLAWLTACAVGVILTITDTVSVIAAFRTVPVPGRLATIVEGESLFNDGIALVLLNIVTTIHLQGSFSVGEGVEQILIAFVGGGLLGLGLGYLCIGLFRQLDDPLSNILLTVAVSLGTFQIGQALGVSSAIAVLIAGLLIGNVALRECSGSVTITLLNFWEYAGFGVNTFIFLFVGIEVAPLSLLQTIPAALLAVVAYQVGRICSIYPLLSVLKFFDRPLPLRWQHVLIFGNVKGSLSMALALGLPLTLQGRSQVITLVFSTVLVSLIGQGLSLPWFVKKLQLAKPSPVRQHLENLQLNLIAAKSAQEELKELLQSGSLPKFLYEELFASYQARIANAEEELRGLYNQRLTQKLSQFENQAYLEGLRHRLFLAEKSAINEAILKGLISDETARPYLQELNQKILALRDP
ncbi:MULTISPECIES: sodium:proton antiporter [Cyanophyceae]|uniref:cation:proton antiporter n=1 Tax=unclassified Picosynechococcus TaxID=3079910 RepID=UPI00016DC584|nr:MULTISPECIES: sodium:proton antiporter [Cyanophyceae]ACA99006.1 Na+/H+-exchanging protein [Picosynechococcus sp. PCC 7002]SMH35864.1 sodium/proton antiporter, CPA1 family [Picosynechococcus sp. OG1]SMQ84877.1 sodium/proton antiporter, CPA1 family [Synechococcus sp. 7002]